MRQTAKRLKRMQTHEPRAAYCVGCNTLFPKMHLMFHHRWGKQCGGKYLSNEERMKRGIRLIGG